MFSLPLSASAGCVDGDAPGAVGRALDHSPDHRAAGAATADGTFAAGTAPVRTGAPAAERSRLERLSARGAGVGR